MCKLCVNCGAPATCEHHIVPIALGGNDIPSNKVPLCDKCHGAIHSVSFGEGCLSHGELIKRGLQKKKDAISRGEVYRARSGRISEGLGGRPALTINDLPSHFVEIYNNHNYKNISDLARKCGMSRTTVYKYIEVLTQ
jgi:radical SAM superfamily enzyme YgiQ (UPF0313 family)